jgi:hypothetical protein
LNPSALSGPAAYSISFRASSTCGSGSIAKVPISPLLFSANLAPNSLHSRAKSASYCGLSGWTTMLETEVTVVATSFLPMASIVIDGVHLETKSQFVVGAMSPLRPDSQSGGSSSQRGGQIW